MCTTTDSSYLVQVDQSSVNRIKEHSVLDQSAMVSLELVPPHIKHDTFSHYADWYSEENKVQNRNPMIFHVTNVVFD